MQSLTVLLLTEQIKLVKKLSKVEQSPSLLYYVNYMSENTKFVSEVLRNIFEIRNINRRYFILRYVSIRRKTIYLFDYVPSLKIQLNFVHTYAQQ